MSGIVKDGAVESPHTTDVQSTQTPATPVLELKQATFRGRSRNALSIRQVDLTVRQGELVVIHVDRAQDTREFVSTLQGLRPLSAGELYFEGESWTGRDNDRHFKMRSRIGRVFDGDAWVDNLNVIENVMLSPSHHRLDPRRLAEDIKQWSTVLDSPQLTRERPSFVDPTTLQRLQWLRAFIGQRTLLLLERPMKSLSSDYLPTLVSAVNKIRQQLVAVIWFAGTDAEALADFPDPTHHYRLHNDKLVTGRGRGNATVVSTASKSASPTRSDDILSASDRSPQRGVS